MGTRTSRSKERNQQYDAVYYLRNRDKLLPQMRNRANAPEQKLYRQLYVRWRIAVKGKKVPDDEPFDKPSKEDRLDLLKKKDAGCEQCEKRENLELDHIDGYPNNNSLGNLRWLCHDCHKKKTTRERRKGAWSVYEDLAKKRPYTKR